MWDGHPTCDEINDEQCALLRESLAELVFLLFRQVGLNDLELLALDCFNNLINHSSARQQEHGRGAYCDLVAHLVDKVVVNMTYLSSLFFPRFLRISHSLHRFGCPHLLRAFGHTGHSFSNHLLCSLSHPLCCRHSG